ncbi:hypothetical protein [Nocardia sp. CC227C]|uniref:hypothetical protein n=1 Tax=Nocardia sp. CC227C TaxID=3044562 RepID=UPI00278BD7DD|nr:hypothetical protein [Nocardia sp. CC227C]
MPTTKLKECPQELWLGDVGYSSGGICYYMSEYVRESMWNGVKKFSEAVEVAKNAVPATIVKAGKAKNLRDKGGEAHGKAQQTYHQIPADLAANKVYRVGLWFGKNGKNPDSAQHQNHEAVVLTSGGTEVVFFEPNFGFYHADENTTRKAAFEGAVRALYTGNGDHAENFHYREDRTVK